MKRWSLVLVGLLSVSLLGMYVFGPRLHSEQPPQRTMIKEIYSYRDIVKRVLPAVVSIESEAKVKPRSKLKQPGKRSPRLDDPRIPEEFRKFFEEFGSPDEMPDESPRLGFGSGFVIDAKGVILTNFHVVDGADHVIVHLKDGRKFTSRDIKGDKKTDLAIVRIKAGDQGPLPYLELGDSDAMDIGDRVLAVGAPFGLTGTVTHGIVSAKGRNGLQMNMYEDFIQTDAAINPGNSGGPLVNLDGKVIGINSAIKTRSGGFQGIGLAVASNLARNVVQSLQKYGVVHRGYLGIQITELAPAVAARLGVPKDSSGVVVSDVFKGSPAAKAGVQPGDIVTNLGGKSIKDGRELQTTVAGLPLHKPVDVTVLREGKSRVLPVTIEEQPGDFGVARNGSAPQRTPESPTSVDVDKVGMELSDLTPDLAKELDYREGTKGVVITNVDPGSPASTAGLRKGMLITKVDRRPVTSATAAREALQKANLEQGALLQVQAPGRGTNFVLLKVEPATR